MQHEICKTRDIYYSSSFKGNTSYPAVMFAGAIPRRWTVTEFCGFFFKAFWTVKHNMFSWKSASFGKSTNKKISSVKACLQRIDAFELKNDEDLR